MIWKERPAISKQIIGILEEWDKMTGQVDWDKDKPLSENVEEERGD